MALSTYVLREKGTNSYFDENIYHNNIGHLSAVRQERKNA